jgi:hypothetical protein
MTFKLDATNLQNVTPGNTATLTLPVGKNAPTLDKLQFELGGGLLPAHLLSVIGKGNGRMFFEEDEGAVAINKRDAYRGLFVENGFLTIDFTEPKARNGAVEQLLASVPMSQLQKLTFDIKIDAAAPAGSTLKAQMHLRQPTSNPYILKRLNTTQAFANAGQHIMYLPTGGAGGKMKRIWIEEETSPGGVDYIEIRVGNTLVHETTRAALEHSQKKNGLTPQAGIVCLDFIEDGNLSGVLDTGSAANVELRINGVADTYKVVYDFIDPINRL